MYNKAQDSSYHPHHEVNMGVTWKEILVDLIRTAVLYGFHQIV